MNGSGKNKGECERSVSGFATATLEGHPSISLIQAIWQEWFFASLFPEHKR